MIRKHERRRRARPTRLSVCRSASIGWTRGTSTKLSDEFDLELFSPHIEDMDSSNNCSIVLKIEGVGPGGFEITW